jgi:lysyl-tRNA synthetase class 2
LGELLLLEFYWKKKKGTWPVDPDFIAALESGIPAKRTEVVAGAGGIALGIDRMVVLFTGAKDINEVLFQSVQDQLTI